MPPVNIGFCIYFRIRQSPLINHTKKTLRKRLFHLIHQIIYVPVRRHCLRHFFGNLRFFHAAHIKFCWSRHICLIVSRCFLLLLFSRRRPFGILLYEEFGIKVVQTWAGCIIAATVIAFPLMYRNARAAFEQIDVNLIHAARTLGMPEYKIFWKVAVPSAGPGLVAGTILTFARALGEYGATSMLAGNIPGKTGTVSQKIAMVIQDGDYKTAGFWSVVVLLVGFLAMTAMNLLGNRRKKNQKQW
jgi:molybdate transport system permease protein